jgi:hypothetical protein
MFALGMFTLACYTGVWVHASYNIFLLVDDSYKRSKLIGNSVARPRGTCISFRHFGQSTTFVLPSATIPASIICRQRSQIVWPHARIRGTTCPGVFGC